MKVRSLLYIYFFLWLKENSFSLYQSDVPTDTLSWTNLGGVRISLKEGVTEKEVTAKVPSGRNKDFPWLLELCAHAELILRDCSFWACTPFL